MVDLLDLDDGEFLSVPDLAMVALSAFHFEGYDFRASDVFDDVGNDGCRGDSGCAHRDIPILIDEEDTVEGVAFAGLRFHPFNAEFIAGSDTVLFTACF
jgi:hypothetical protein